MGFITDLLTYILVKYYINFHDIIVDELDTEKAITILHVKVSDNYDIIYNIISIAKFSTFLVSLNISI